MVVILIALSWLVEPHWCSARKWVLSHHPTQPYTQPGVLGLEVTAPSFPEKQSSHNTLSGTLVPRTALGKRTGECSESVLSGRGPLSVVPSSRVRALMRPGRGCFRFLGDLTVDGEAVCDLPWAPLPVPD